MKRNDQYHKALTDARDKIADAVHLLPEPPGPAHPLTKSLVQMDAALVYPPPWPDAEEAPQTPDLRRQRPMPIDKPPEARVSQSSP